MEGSQVVCAQVSWPTGLAVGAGCERELVLCVGVWGEAVGKSLSKHLLNKTLQREYDLVVRYRLGASGRAGPGASAGGARFDRKQRMYAWRLLSTFC